MKSFPTPVLIILFVIFSVRAYSHASCFPRNDSMITPVVHEINVTGHIGNKLVLVNATGGDGSKIEVLGNDIVNWNTKDADVIIMKINQKFLRKNRFKKKPAFKLVPNCFQGQLENYKKVRTEHYFIKWKDNNGKIHRHDPLIRINPNTFDTTP